MYVDGKIVTSKTRKFSALNNREFHNNTFLFSVHRFFDSLEKLANHVSIMHSSVAKDNLYYCKWEGCVRTERGFNARYKMLVHW